MLTKHMRKKFQEHDWLEIARRDSNPNQTLLRLKRQAKRAIGDLALLARKLPNDNQKAIFNYANIQELVNSILNVNTETDARVEESIFNWSDIEIVPDARRTELAALLVRRGTDFCIKEYQNVIQPNHILNEPILSQLLKSVDICRGISNEITLKGGASSLLF